MKSNLSDEEFKEHIKMTCSIIVDDIYDNFSMYNSYFNNKNCNKQENYQNKHIQITQEKSKNETDK